MFENQGGVFVPDRLDWRQAPLFDTLQVAAAAQIGATVTLFGRPTSSVAAATVNITNVDDTFKLAFPEQMLIQAVRLVFIASPIADVETFMKNYRVSLVLGKKAYCEGGAEYYPAGAGVFTSGQTALAAGAQATNSAVQNGVPDVRNVNVFQSGYQPWITAGTTIKILLEGTSFAPAADLFLRVYLDGLRGVGAQ